MFLFKNLTLFSIDDYELSESELSERLKSCAFSPCAAAEEEAVGWVSPMDADPDNFTYQISGAQVLLLKRESKSIPAKVIAERAEPKIATARASLPDGQKLDPDTISAIKDDVKRELLPQAFSTSEIIQAYIDTQRKMLVVNTSSTKKADLVTGRLIDALAGGAGIEPIKPLHDVDEIMANWMRNDDAPEDIMVGNKCKVVRNGESGSITYQKQMLEDDDQLRKYLSGGRKISEMQMCWAERASFVLTSDFIFKGLKLVGDLSDEIKEMKQLDWSSRFDASFALLVAQVRQLYDGMMAHLGGDGR